MSQDQEAQALLEQMKQAKRRLVVPGEAHAALGMAGLVAVGGVLAFAKGAKKSAAISAAYALGYAFSGETIRRGEGEYGHGAAALLGSFLAVSMGFRFAATRKLFPPGVLGVAGALSGAYHTYKWYQWKY